MKIEFEEVTYQNRINVEVIGDEWTLVVNDKPIACVSNEDRKLSKTEAYALFFEYILEGARENDSKCLFLSHIF